MGNVVTATTASGVLANHTGCLPRNRMRRLVHSGVRSCVSCSSFPFLSPRRTSSFSFGAGFTVRFPLRRLFAAHALHQVIHHFDILRALLSLDVWKWSTSGTVHPRLS